MKRVGVISTAFFLLVLGIVIPACAQHEQNQDEQGRPTNKLQPPSVINPNNSVPNINSQPGKLLILHSQTDPKPKN